MAGSGIRGTKLESRKMNRFWLLFLSGVLLVQWATPSLAPGGSKPGKTFNTFTFYLENDVFAVTDENYTHGCGFSWVSKDFRSERRAPFLSRPFYHLLTLLGKTGSFRNISISFRQNIYTPSDISRSEYIQNDHPYAGITYFPIGFHAKNQRCLSSLEFDVGIVGPHSYADRSQKQVHKWIDSPDPKGWNNQIKDEVILNLNYDRRWRFYSTAMKRPFGFDLLPHIGYGFGNMKIYLDAGGQLRAGWHLPHNFGSYIIQPGCECQLPADLSGVGSGDQDPVVSVHGFIGADARVVFRDIFLDGNTFKQSPRVEKNTLREELVFGIGIQILHFKLNYSYTLQTRIFKTQKKAHRYGGITLSVLI